jgi:hypothetical protein
MYQIFIIIKLKIFIIIKLKILIIDRTGSKEKKNTYGLKSFTEDTVSVMTYDC